MKIHTDDENDPVWIPFGLKVQLEENGSLKIEEYSDEDPIPENPGKYMRLSVCLSVSPFVII